MKVDKVLSRFASAPEDEGELRRLARALGDELSRQRLRVMQRFRAGLVRVRLPDPRSFAAGYVAALLDTVAEYEVSVRQASDEKELQRLAVREEWHQLLFALREGPKLPSELALRLGKDRPSVTRVLKRLRTAGLVQAFADESLDGRMRPHRLTVDGRRLLAKMRAQIPDEVERGITVAVSLFRHLATNASSSALDLDTLAEAILDDPEAATAAVTTWAQRAREAGLLTEVAAPRQPVSPPQPGPKYHLTTPTSGSAGDPAAFDPRNEALWLGIPQILAQIAGRKDERGGPTRDAPVYVRTSHGAWGAWAYALQNRDTTGMSRAIVDGDLLTGTMEPPSQPFHLVYDDPEMLRADRDRPAMQEFMARADEKFVVSSGDEDVPEGFIQLELAPGNEE